VTIDAEPTRVVALDFPSADAALALGVVPVGMAEISYVEGGMHSWTADALDGAATTVFPIGDGYPLETIARLDPDVILAVGNAYPPVADSWERLNAIAPVVTTPHGQGSRENTWQEGHLQAGRALGKAELAAEQVAEAEGGIAEAREANPAFAGKTVTFFNYAAGVLYLINTNDDTSVKFLRDLGFAGVTDAVAAMPDMAGSPGRAEVSAERYPSIDADLILGTSSDGRIDDLTAVPTFARIPAVERGAFVSLDVGKSTAMVYPSVLSLAYAVEHLTPELAEALGG
jgi:iron complex transport system substrate-binding protein